MLRPLGLGEILDRAVTLCVRHFALFSLIVVVYAVPLALFQFLGTGDQAKVFAAFSSFFQAQAAGKHVDMNALSKALAESSVGNWWTVLWISTALLVSPLPTAALIDAAAVTYLGGSTTFERAYRVAVERWLPLIGVNLLFLASGIGVYIVIFIALLILILGVAAITKASLVLGATLGVILGLIALVAFLALAVLASLALQVAYFTCVVEKMPFVTSFSRGIGRVFAGAGLRRSLLVGLAFVAISIGIGLVSLVGESLLYGLLHSNVLGTVYQTLVRVATAAFTTAFIAIFYFDLRVRTEGLDLQVAAGGDPLPAS